jgi:hypothetical protein
MKHVLSRWCIAAALGAATLSLNAIAAAEAEAEVVGEAEGAITINGRRWRNLGTGLCMSAGSVEPFAQSATCVSIPQQRWSVTQLPGSLNRHIIQSLSPTQNGRCLSLPAGGSASGVARPGSIPAILGCINPAARLWTITPTAPHRICVTGTSGQTMCLQGGAVGSALRVQPRNPASRAQLWQPISP